MNWGIFVVPDFFISSIVALIACLFCIKLLKPLAMRIGFVDRPNQRKLHHHNVPLIGGIAIFFGFSLGLLALNYSLQPYRGMLAGSAILLLMGVVDDFRELSSRLRLVGQLFAALLLVGWGHVIINELGALFFMHPLTLGVWAVPVTILVVMANLNAMNMIDGQDGLAGGVALGQALLLWFLAHHLAMHVDEHLLLILIVLLVVFLCFNMPLPWRSQAAIFLGDSGSTLIAFLLAWFAIDVSQHSIVQVKPMVVLWVMALPLFDLVNVVIHRFRQGKSIFVASRDHFHHVLHVAGVNASLSTILLCAVSLFLGVIGIMLNDWQVAEGWQFIGFTLALIVYFFVVALTRKPTESSI